mmetsp:Transcript_19251/g.44840  ORF Transcript_19251/g.44840 Transcript_19251/m.44840 type:complete len:89 (+) Transcript_19251:87-353(+)
MWDFDSWARWDWATRAFPRCASLCDPMRSKYWPFLSIYIGSAASDPTRKGKDSRISAASGYVCALLEARENPSITKLIIFPLDAQRLT